MSGGHYNYFHRQLEEFIDSFKRDIADSNQNDRYTRLERVLADRLVALADVLHNIEWYRSGDIGRDAAERKIVDYLETFGFGVQVDLDAKRWRDLIAAVKADCGDDER